MQRKDIFKNYLLLLFIIPKVSARSFIFLIKNLIYLKILVSGLEKFAFWFKKR
jgi:hypothetical protein